MHKNTGKHHKFIFFLAVAVIVIIVVIIFMVRGNKIKQTAVIIPAENTSQNTPKPSGGKQVISSNNNIPNSDKSSQSSTQSSTLIQPSGIFVSNHRPSLSGSSAFRQEQSVCNTTPGATCFIQFTKNGVVQELTPEVTDSQGSAFWTWDISQSGLTQGSWVVSASATLNGKVMTATDSMMLEVQP